MKKYISFLFLLLFSATGLLKAQPWNENMPNDTPNFFQIQKVFEEYWRGKTKEKGTGYNVFKRWEWFWEQRVGQSGTFPDAMHDYYEWAKFNQQLFRRTDFGGNWRPMGPTTTPSGYDGLGRLNCIAFHPTDTATFWVGAPSGGVWKTTDFGKNWITTTDKNPVLGVSSIAVNPLHPDTVYAATGDGDRGSLWGMTGGAQGDNKSMGVIMSADGGMTWQSTGLNWLQQETKLIRKLLIHPQKPWILLCSSSDGIWKTTNSGKTWRRIISGYYMDMEFMPGNYDIVYATTFVSSGSGNARIVKSTDGGETFSTAYTVPNGGRIALGTTAAMPELVHLLVSHRSGGSFEGIYESVDTGKTFVKIFDSPNILAHTYDGSGTSGQGWYDLSYTLSQVNPDICYVGGVNTWISTDRGKTFELLSFWTGSIQRNPNRVPVVHADKHHFTHHPLQPETMFDCNDGGVYFTKDQGKTWTDISKGLNITQFYRFAITPSDTGIVLGGTQDNGARILKDGQWGQATGGDGMECGIDPFDPEIMYSSYAYGVLYRSVNGFSSSFSTTTISNNIPGRPSGAWVTPYKLDPKRSGTIIAGYRDVYRTENYGNTWEKISTSLATGQLLRNIAIANKNSSVLYAGDYYRIYRTWDGGLTWERIVVSSTPITMIEVHPENDSVIYYTHSSYTGNQKVIKYDATQKGNGQSVNLSKNLPNVPVNCLAVLKEKSDALFVGTDIGVFYLANTEAEWTPFMEGLPNVVVTDLKLNYDANLLYAATFGRGIWKSNLFLSKTPPFVVRLSPDNGETNVKIDTDVQLYFSTVIERRTGNLSFYYEDETEPFHVVAINDSSVQVVGDSALLVVFPEKLNYESKVSVRVPFGAIYGYNYIPFGGIQPQNWSFETERYIDKTITEKSFNVYPNPASNTINVACTDCEDTFEAIFYSLTGQPVMKVTDIDRESLVDVSSLSTGTYILTIHYQDQHFSRLVLVNLSR